MELKVLLRGLSLNGSGKGHESEPENPGTQGGLTDARAITSREEKKTVCGLLVSRVPRGPNRLPAL